MVMDPIRRRLRLRQLFSAIAAGILMISILAACSSSSAGSSEGAKSAPQSNLNVSAATDNKAEPAAAQAAPGGPGTNGQTGNGTGTAGNSQPGDDGFNRKIIYKANLQLQVKSYDTAQKQLRDLVAKGGAYILNFSEFESKSEIGGTYTIKVAADGFVSMLDSIETISKAKQRSVQGQDVTEEYVDLTARLKAKETVEKRLLDFMDKAAKADELLAYSKELSTVQEEIERIKGRMRYLEQNVAYSTIEVRIVQPIDVVTASMDEDDSLLSRMGSTISKSYKVLTKVGEGIVIVLTALLPFVIPAAIIAWLIVLLIRRRRRISDARRTEELLARQRMAEAMEARNREMSEAAEARNQEMAKAVESNPEQLLDSARDNES